MSMFMSVGTPYCCGVLEIFPRGEFTPARGHGYADMYVSIYLERYKNVLIHCLCSLQQHDSKDGHPLCSNRH